MRGAGCTPQRQAIRPVDKGAENAVFSGVGLLLVVVVPDLFDEGEFGNGKFAGQGRVVVGGIVTKCMNFAIPDM